MTMPCFSRERDAFRRVLACTTAISLLLPVCAAARDLSFGGPGNDWFSAENWTGGSQPEADDTATVEGAAEAVVFAGEARAGKLVVADRADGSLLVRDPLATNDATVGSGAGAAGTVTLSGELGRWTNAGNITLGDSGAGRLEITEGATVTSNTLRMGDAASGEGTLFLKGEGSRLDLGGVLQAGVEGNGAVMITAGAALSTGSARLGVNAGSSASLTVDRQGSTFASGSLVAGENGATTLEITAGGKVLIGGDAVFGQLASGSGTARITGEDSLLDVGGALTIGNAGNGSLTVVDGAHVNARSAVLGKDGGAGLAHLSGLGTRWTVSETFEAASGTLAIDGAAVLAAGSAALGSQAGQSASATLSGSGSSLSVAGAFDIGRLGNGSLTIATGGGASAGVASIGGNVGGTGAVTVDGEDSKFSVSDSLDVGHLGNGSLKIVAGAGVSAGRVVAGGAAGGEAAIFVDGDGSSLAVDGSFDVARLGTASVTVSGGAKVSAGAVTIAAGAGSRGTLNIGADESSLAAGAGTLEAATIRFGDGDGTLVLNHGETDYELSAALSGTGTVKVLRGTTILTGENSHDGVTAISSGATLSIGNGATGGTAGTGDIVNDGQLIFNRADETAFSGAISGTGSLTKSGAGLLTLSGNSTYGGITRIDEGRLNADGTLVSAVTVASGATLGGSGGTGDVSVASGGALAAEGLSVSGDLTLSPGATLAVSAGEAEAVSVTGTANLDGANLALAYTQGKSLVNHYTLVQAGAISGTLSTSVASGLSDRFTVTGSTGGTVAAIDLAYDAGGVVLSGTGANGAHASLASAFNSGQTLSGIAASALAADGDALQRAMTALSGESGASARSMAPLALQGFLETASRTGGSQHGNAGETTVWTRMTGSTVTFDADALKGTGSARTNLAGLEGGLLHAFDTVWTGGLALSLGSGHFMADDASATGRYGQAAFSLAGRFANGAYISSAAGFGLMATGTRRTLAIGESVEGDFTTRAAGLDLEGGMDFALGEAVLTPFAGISLVHVDAPAYREKTTSGTGGAALHYTALDQWSGTMRLGLEASRDMLLGEFPATFGARIAYLHRFAGSGRSSAAFTALSGGYFDLENLTRRDDAIALSASAALATGTASDLRLDVGGEWSGQGYGFTGRLGFNLRW